MDGWMEDIEHEPSVDVYVCTSQSVVVLVWGRRRGGTWLRLSPPAKLVGILISPGAGCL